MKPTEMKPNSNIQNPTSKIQNPKSINQPQAMTPQDIVDGMYEFCGQWHEELMTDLICPVVGEVLGHSVGPSCLVLNLTLSGSVAGGPDLSHLSIFFGDGHPDEIIEVFAEDQGELTRDLLRDTHDWAIAHLDTSDPSLYSYELCLKHSRELEFSVFDSENPTPVAKLTTWL